MAENIFKKSQAVSPKLTMIFQAKLLETLCVLSNKFEDLKRQQEFIRNAIGQTVRFWSTSALNK